jgi:hypothetical protein
MTKHRSGKDRMLSGINDTKKRARNAPAPRGGDVPSMLEDRASPAGSDAFMDHAVLLFGVPDYFH